MLRSPSSPSSRLPRRPHERAECSTIGGKSAVGVIGWQCNPALGSPNASATS
jgi:hypothetical protein